VELMSKHNLSEFKVEAENMRLSLKRGVHGITGIPSQIIQPAVTASPQHMTAALSQEAPKTTPITPLLEKKNTIDAPIVGTFYLSPSPDAQEFVKVGDKVTPNTVVCIIEAMKVMNEVKAEKSGTIKEILVKNAQSVEYGCPLFVVE
jgi:acetyl-CoA carboxylase biotin carboxyl carrier protein